MTLTYNPVLGIATVQRPRHESAPIVASKTVFPSHVIRKAAFDRFGNPGEALEDFLQRHRIVFAKKMNLRRWDGTAQMRFDQYLQELKS